MAIVWNIQKNQKRLYFFLAFVFPATAGSLTIFCRFELVATRVTTGPSMISTSSSLSPATALRFKDSFLNDVFGTLSTSMISISWTVELDVLLWMVWLGLCCRIDDDDAVTETTEEVGDVFWPWAVVVRLSEIPEASGSNSPFKWNIVSVEVSISHSKRDSRQSRINKCSEQPSSKDRMLLAVLESTLSAVAMSCLIASPVSRAPKWSNEIDPEFFITGRYLEPMPRPFSRSSSLTSRTDDSPRFSIHSQGLLVTDDPKISFPWAS